MFWTTFTRLTGVTAYQVSVLVDPCSTDVHPFEFSRLQAKG